MTNELTIAEIMQVPSSTAWKVDQINMKLAAKDAAMAVMEAESAAMADALKQLAETVGLGVGHTAAEIVDAVKAQLAEPANPVPGEWIEWAGGECPIADGVGFQFKFRDDSQNKECAHYKATEWDWNDCAADADIVAYRVLP